VSFYTHIPHPRIQQRKAEGPVKTADQLPSSTNSIVRFNNWSALKITAVVGTMWCAYVFTGIALVSLPAALGTGQLIVIIAWIAQTFLQLVLLSVIIVGQNLAAAASDKRAEATYLDAEAVLHEALQIQQHLLEQDKALADLIGKLKEKP
jgi:cytochrome c biogenesis factor